ncbi:conserved hypothetical protein [Uncinocarpus reesii 1704]|uniref:Anaphase-promoting complex subunit 5 n=1 Tax=Uncinocarpus reesii (strain UAMH 1704) TaxID=336963 RepID=C4JE36_UNCRE|nr:uncharacterized protein UREG_00460 [Uncinocarpus reesii 1704]EEP75614.1 conserved hypothetical protein [Uncinocarpus reesii 1704]
MARYLTPSKIALLALVSIYSEGVVPNSAIVALLSFFMTHVLPLDTLDARRRAIDQENAHTISLEEFEEVTSSLASSIPGRTVWDLFLKRIWQLDCVDSLEEFFTLVSDLITKPREEQIRERSMGIVPEPGKMLLSRTSPLGMFVRRAQLEYARLQFHDSVALWRAFIKYRMPTYHTWAKRNPMNNQSKVDVNIVELGLDLDSPLAKVIYGDLDDTEEDAKVAMSTKDMEKLLDFQVQEMQSNKWSQFLSSLGKGTRVTKEMRNKLQQMLASGVALPNLSHYADFGCLGEAISAMQETISIARETQDMHCLNYCISWLYHCRRAYPDALNVIQNTGMLGSDREALAFLKAKARENEMWTLLGTSLLSEAKLELSYGESIASVFEHIAQASHLNTSQNLNSSMGQLLVLQAAFFMRLGTNVELQKLSLSGNYSQALQQLEDISPHTLHRLKNQQLWTFVCGLLKLRQQLHRDNKVAAEHLVTQLRACVVNEPEHTAALSLSEVEFLICKGDYSAALKLIENIAKSTQQGLFDVALQIKLLNLKAQIFQKTDQPERAFSLVMRAASIAYRSRVLPGLWEALGNLAVILMVFREFEAAVDTLESIMPQVLEGDDSVLAARTYSLLVDANMGLAGRTKQDMVRQKEYIAKASEFIDCAFAEYSKVGNLNGQCEMTAKKATLMHLSGDLALANDYAARYLDFKRQARMEAMGS